MRLISPQTFAKRYFDEADTPDERTIRSWVELGVITGKLINTGRRKQVYIDADAWERTTGNKLADEVLKKLG